MKIKIVSDGTSFGTRVLDEAGNEIENVVSIRWSIQPGGLAYLEIAILGAAIEAIGEIEGEIIVGTLEETNEAPAPADALARDSHCWHNTGVVWQLDASKHVDVCCQCGRSRLVAEEEATRHGTFKPACCGRELEIHGVEEVTIVDREFWDAIQNPKPLNIAAPLKDASRD